MNTPGLNGQPAYWSVTGNCHNFSKPLSIGATVQYGSGNAKDISMVSEIIIIM